MGRPYVDLTGQRFGRLVAIERLGLDKKRQHSLWLCRCDCGNVKAVSAGDLQQGDTVSCGCYAREASSARCAALTGERNPRYKYGTRNKNGERVRLYRIWTGMKNRCTCPSSPHYLRYGGRGISICDEWLHNYGAFRDWALSHGYQDDLSIDRIDNDGPYSPDNCRWVTKRVQALNRNPYKHKNHKTPLYEINGVPKSAKEWANEIGISAQGFTRRYSIGKRGADLLRPTIRKKEALPCEPGSNTEESR